MSEGLFYQSIQDLLPEDQEVTTVSPDTPVQEALQRMREQGYSQLPVVNGDGKVEGVFSYRSFGNQMESLLGVDLPKEDFVVETFMESDFPFCSMEARPGSVFDDLNRKGAILVGSKDDLQGIATPMDALQVLHAIARRFVVVAEIEQLLREIIGTCVTEDELEECAMRALERFYDDRSRIPTRLEEMTMFQYRMVILKTKNWETHFQGAFAPRKSEAERRVLIAMLEEIQNLRNEVFHLRSISEREIDALRDHRARLRRLHDRTKQQQSPQSVFSGGTEEEE